MAGGLDTAELAAGAGSHRSRLRARLSLVAVLALVVGFASACGPTVTAPNVVGMRLDDAHRAFEALGVDEFEDVDVIGDENTIFLDSNWVVVKQDPAAGTKEVDTGTTIKLQVGNEDDDEVLELIPADSDFAIEVNGEPEQEPTEEPEPEPEKSEEPEPTQSPTEPEPTASPSEKIPPAAACVRRKGNPGEIYVWNSYGTDQPPDAMRLGAGFVWDFGEEECITSTEFALRANPGIQGYCSEVGKVRANPGYRVNQRPADRLANVSGVAGDC